MRIFAVECSALASSVAIVEQDKLLCEFFTNTGLTHSQTLMPMAQSALTCAGIELNSIDCFAIASGPGSFTGVRIGIAALKGIAIAQEKPCMPVSALEALAYNFLFKNCIACCVMDARCNQVYTATFRCTDTVQRLTADEALMIDELKYKLQNYDLPVVFVGDGANLCYNALKDELCGVKLAPLPLRYQRASSVAFCAMDKLKTQDAVSVENLLPVYLRVPQAERELKKRMESKK
ncbi:MAG: tRNA (adenosine(37)-N6)-threonylcarbamoyltransferase complex dimerization subunit type 1 TsaB [Oscillospiraceae bacterium]|jgi:tRNA threonylcarbamoyladenosine biosynthesis protein TsaB|nr:tRNA (adenosine(37)-N6)-threonylcarbamoyltransferase complex dimerization subunit type 1 TsaB [Oscillospiraceae bacterium]